MYSASGQILAKPARAGIVPSMRSSGGLDFTMVTANARVRSVGSMSFSTPAIVDTHVHLLLDPHSWGVKV